jgi:hypothetical protein
VSVLDVAVALLMGVVILRLGLWAVRLLRIPAPEPDPDEVVPVQVDYRCSVCGTQVTMTHASGRGISPPRHCREEMEPVPSP